MALASHCCTSLFSELGASTRPNWSNSTSKNLSNVLLSLPYLMVLALSSSVWSKCLFELSSRDQCQRRVNRPNASTRVLKSLLLHTKFFTIISSHKLLGKSSCSKQKRMEARLSVQLSAGSS
ncbi:hypothetical protein BpHYR1_019067 [Brachionus plicatilis]|uniref:Uncharacterized protein n=1 Tax=Brachionus plicatilis TaxID=10195 RepID=A0A3M7SFJ5_BRAPC|nr:hypothetical protein BpHYR1_019067 [Brachionus plicatilis]